MSRFFLKQETEMVPIRTGRQRWELRKAAARVGRRSPEGPEPRRTPLPLRTGTRLAATIDAIQPFVLILGTGGGRVATSLGAQGELHAQLLSLRILRTFCVPEIMGCARGWLLRTDVPLLSTFGKSGYQCDLRARQRETSERLESEVTLGDGFADDEIYNLQSLSFIYFRWTQLDTVYYFRYLPVY